MSAIRPADTCHRASVVRGYRSLSLRQLIQRVVNQADTSALREFHNNRRVFRSGDGLPLLLAEFVTRLAGTGWSDQYTQGRSDILERARDMTLDKFAILPAESAEAGRGGVDCRHYFRGFLGRVDEMLAGCLDTANVLIGENAVAWALQKHVCRHFHLSFKEALRSSNPARSRYAWHFDGGVIYLWMPASLPGFRRREWLETHVPDPQPSRPGEQARIQSIIDAHWGLPRHVSLNGQWAGADGRCAGTAKPAASLEEAITLHGLASVVASEKADNIDLLRPAIRAIGRQKLHSLVLRIFEALSDGNYEEKALAEAFGLSRPTFSRFAGSQWRRSEGAVPDLWKNVAQTLAQHELFTEAARNAGVWEQVEGILDR